jgi:hypothetical protein
MPCEKYFQLNREHESAVNEHRLFKTPFGAGGTKKERAKVSQTLEEQRQEASVAFFNHAQHCEACKKEQ